jgi:hypothetical protein
MWRAAARRFAILLAVVSTGIVVISYLLGLALGSAADRSISLGFYFVGAFLAFAGFFVGNRGPIRAVGEDSSGGGWRLGRGLRRASQEEQQESVAIGGLLAVLGFVLLAIGVAVDSRYQLI